MAVKNEAFLLLEDSLAQRMDKAVKSRYLNKIQKAASLARQGKFPDAHDLINSIDVTDGVEQQRKYIELVGMQAILFGARDFSAARDTIFSGKPPPDELKLATDSIITMFATALNEQIRKRAHRDLENEEVRQKESTVVVEKAATPGFVAATVRNSRKATKSTIDLAASLHTSRLASWGFTVEAEALDYEAYEVSEVLDGRTCEVCKHMDGKVFPVATAKRKLEGWLGVSDPNDLKSIAKWPGQSKADVQRLKNMSDSEIIGAGWDTPPYHPLCRGVLRKTSQKVDLDVPVPTPVGRPTPGKAPFVSAAEYYKTFDKNVTEDEIIKAVDPNAKRVIEDFEKKVAQITPTDKIYRDANGFWDQDRVENVHDEIVKKILTPEVIQRTKPRGTPTYVVLGGRGGSGKSWLTSADGPVDESKFLVLDSDSIKALLPEYKGWNAFEVHEESSYLFDKITRVAQTMGLNVVHDMTLKSPKSAVKRVNSFHQSGYKIEGHYMYLPRQEAAKRAVYRAINPESQRYVPINIILNNTENEKVFDSLIQYFSKWSMYDNNVPRGTLPQFVAGG